MLSRALVLFALFVCPVASAQDVLTVAADGKTKAVVVVDAKAGKWEKQAATDLVKYIERMTGAKPALANPVVEDDGKSPVLVVGSAALKADPTLAAALAKVGKDPVLRKDAIVLRRTGNRVLIAGTNDDSHYYAAAELLRRWGCRWYLPTEIGECVPEVKTLTVGALDYAYAPPFEVRNYWVSWNGSNDGQDDFMRRNFMNTGVGVPNGHAIGEYVGELIPKGKSVFDIPIAEDSTADHIVKKVSPKFAKGEYFSLGMEDGVYRTESKLDKQLMAGLKDKYFLSDSLADPFLTLYNKVSERLLKAHPNSTARIGFLAYGNLTIPPQRKIVAAKPLVAYLAPIDIDPIHGMDDPKSPPRHEYKEMMYRWAEVMQGRVVIYDYDQGMLVWRDLPNPSIQSIRQDIKHYKKAGILGVSTECRNAIATVFLNLHVRAQLYWNPDADVDAMLAEFYTNFYGPAAKPMAEYWNGILKAWEDSIVTEHEHFVIPVIYTPALVEKLRKHLAEAEKLATLPGGEVTRGQQLYYNRVKFARLSFNVIDHYTAMARAAATDGDYKAATAAGEKALAARLELAKMNPTFTTRVVGVAAEGKDSGPAWFPGEVEQYRALGSLTDGTKGTLVQKLPLEWAFRRDPHDTGVVSGWARKPVDLKWWTSTDPLLDLPMGAPPKFADPTDRHRLNPGHWGMLRTDLYMQAQGVVSPDYHSYTGLAWYRTDVTLPAQAGKTHVMFPGLFNEAWLYVNGELVAHRAYKEPWWLSDYKFEWDVDLTGHLKAGANTVAVRVNNPHHFGGMFRRPFLYKPAGK
ncbi:MAG: DUF4838 domain-containing protein [Planctomycetes bacterium]|nr:DUF4838 domain-containing protein [Planctomycetota bacterium]